MYFKKINKNAKGAFFTDKEFEDYITPYFKSCRSIRELNITVEKFLKELKSNNNKFQEEKREDFAITRMTYDNSIARTNETIKLNNPQIAD